MPKKAKYIRILGIIPVLEKAKMMISVQSLRRLSLLMCLFPLLSGCLSDGDTVSGQPVVTPGTGGSASVTASGVLMKGAISNADITIHIPNTDGSIGTQIAGPFITNANGQWSGVLPFGSSGILLVKSSGGVYTDEATGNNISIGTNKGFVGVLDLSASTNAALTPWSYATYLAAKAGIVSSFENAIRDAALDATTSLGFNPLSTILKDPAGSQATATTAEKRYAALTAAFSQLVQDKATSLTAFNNSSPFDLIFGLAQDVSDGKLDGTDAAGNAVQIPIPSGTAGSPALAIVFIEDTGISSLGVSADNFINKTSSLSGFAIGIGLTFDIVIQN